MGCDIHVYMEVKSSVSGVMQWRCADRFSLNRYYKEEGEAQYEVDNIYNTRNYALFSALADVRSGLVASRGDVIPIFSEPRGLPEDINQIIANENMRWGGDGHSHSHATLQELYDYQDKSTNDLLNEVLTPFIEAIEARARTEHWIFHEDDKRVEQEKAEKTRVVFWFDN